MRKLILFTSILEASLGIILILFPSLVMNLIFGLTASDEVKMLGHFSGIVFFSFGLACYPFKEITGVSDLIPAVRGMFSYNLIGAVFFGYLKIEGTYDGILLLPVFILHTLITVCFVFLLVKKK